MPFQPCTGVLFELKGQKFRIEKPLGANVYFCRNIVNAQDVRTLTSVDFTFLIGRQELKLLSAKAAPKLAISDFSQLREEDRKEAIKKYTYLTDLTECIRANGAKLQTVKDSIRATAEKIKDQTPPNVATIYRLKKKFISSGHDIRVLVPNHAAKGDKQQKLEFEVHLIVEEEIKNSFAKSRFVTVNDLHSRIEIQVLNRNVFRNTNGLAPLKTPHISTIRSRLKRLNPYNLIESRYGKAVAEKIYGFIGKKTQPTRPLEICQTDHTVLDLFVLSRKNNLPIGGRPVITILKDIFSRSVCGFHVGFDPAGYLSVMYCLHHAISPKEYIAKTYPRSVVNPWLCHGIPEVLITDNAMEFINRSLEDACYQLNIKLIQAPRGEPEFKGEIERFIQSQNTLLLHSIPGATYSDNKNELLKYGYNPETAAVIYDDDLIEILHIFYSDIFHQRPHKGLQNRKPSSVWEEGVKEHSLILPSSDVDLLVTLGRIESRTLTRLGIEWQGLIYNSPELTPLRIREKGNEVNFKYDPAEISKINVYDRTRDTYISVPALDQQNTVGVSLWEHRVVLRVAKENSKKVDSAALAAARMRIQGVISRCIEKATVRSQRAVARYSGVRFASTKLNETSPPVGLKIDPPVESEMLENVSVPASMSTEVQPISHVEDHAINTDSATLQVFATEFDAD
jgi:putative transposase